jgi:hypothetical protein
VSHSSNKYNSTLPLISALDQDGWLKRRPGIHFTGRWVGPRAGLDECGKSRPSPGIHPRTVQRLVSRYTVYAIPAQTLVLYNLSINPYSNFIFKFMQGG